LIAYWKFDEATGTTAHDAMGQYPGTLSPNARFVPGGISGNALRLSRETNAFVSMGNVLDQAGTSFSLVAWIKMAAGDTSENSLVMAKHAAGTNNGYFVNVNRSAARGEDNKAMFFAGGPLTVPVSKTSVNDGQWHQIVAVHELSGNDLLYVDGIAESVLPSYPTLPSPAPFVIGGASFDGVVQGLFTGLIDEVQVYNRALDAEEVSLLFANPTASVPLYGVVSTLAGSGQATFQDGLASIASFNRPNGGFVGKDRMAYVADTFNHRIRRVDVQTGNTTTWAGSGGVGYQDGPAQTALFNSPLGTFVDGAGNVFVADTGNNRIRKISAGAAPIVTTVAGSGVRGYVDGPATTARFDFPNDLAMDAAGNLYVSEFNNHTIRKVAPDGTVSTFAGHGVLGYDDGVGMAAGFDQPAGLALDREGNVFVTEWGAHRVRKITPAGLVSSFAGSVFPGLLDAQGVQARFYQPDGIVADSSGVLFVTDDGNHTIRRIASDGTVTTVAGTGTEGYADGPARSAQFNQPGGIGLDTTGNLIIADTGNQRIRMISFLSAPRVTVLPSDQTVAFGTDVSLNATVSGSGPLALQWKFNGNAIAGATNSALILTNVQPGNSGTYSVVVNSPALTVESNPVALTVLPPIGYGRKLPIYYAPQAGFAVRLETTSPGLNGVAAYAYAVEDTPPSGWVVSQISDGGSYDSMAGVVKFGPFFDFGHSSLTYQVKPPRGEDGVKTFQGTVSASGHAFPIGGATTILPPPHHPADLNPADFRLTVDEITAYATAWRKGLQWNIGPNPIPIDYVTRAGVLWKNGEFYRFDPSIQAPPLWWTTNTAASLMMGLSQGRAATDSGASSANRLLPSAFVSGETFAVRVQVVPAAAVSVYAVEEHVADGLSIVAISDGGAYDPLDQLVKWGPFFDSAKRELSFQTVAHSPSAGSFEFSGLASFDGTDVVVSGPASIHLGVRLGPLQLPAAGELAVSLSGGEGHPYLIETSTNLLLWSPLTVATNLNGILRFDDSDSLRSPWRFYRAIDKNL
jgi:sugar lactone lactonase YvrE